MSTHFTFTYLLLWLTDDRVRVKGSRCCFQSGIFFLFLLLLCEENPEVFKTQGQSRLLFLLQCLLGLSCAWVFTWLKNLPKSRTFFKGPTSYPLFTFFFHPRAALHKKWWKPSKWKNIHIFVGSEGEENYFWYHILGMLLHLKQAPPCIIFLTLVSLSVEITGETLFTFAVNIFFFFF